MSPDEIADETCPDADPTLTTAASVTLDHLPQNAKAAFDSAATFIQPKGKPTHITVPSSAPTNPPTPYQSQSTSYPYPTPQPSTHPISHA
ncbi:hypothetical protein Slin14017_G054890 [Septoria linicola]|nr:hypothetical protein Slin14017_G054890 [Septoria linicola]